MIPRARTTRLRQQPPALPLAALTAGAGGSAPAGRADQLDGTPAAVRAAGADRRRARAAVVTTVTRAAR